MSEVIDIVVRQRGARTVSGDLSKIGRSSEKSAAAVDSLKRALGTLATGLAVRSILRTADAFTSLQNRVAVFAGSAKEAASATTALLDVANRSRAPLDAVGTLYGRLSLGVGGLKLSSADTVKVVETLAKATTISGASAEEANGALRQLSQGLANDFKSGAQELNSIAEETPFVAKIIADGLGVPVGALKQLGREGKLSAKAVIAAIESQADVVENRFGRVAPTFSQAFTVLKNSTTELVGRLFEATDAGKSFTAFLSKAAGAITSFVGNAKELGAAASVAKGALLALGAVGTILAFQRLGSAILSTAAAMRALTVATLTNPLTAIPAALLAAAGAAYYFRDSMLSIGGTKTTIRDLAAVIGRDLLGALKRAGSAASDFFHGLGAPSITVRGAFNRVEQGILIVGDVGVLVASTLLDAFVKLGQTVAGIFTSIPRAIVAAARGDFSEAGRILGDAFQDSILDSFKGFGDKVKAIVERDLKFDTLGSLSASVGSLDIVKRAGERTAARLAAERAASAGGGQVIPFPGPSTSPLPALPKIDNASNAVAGYVDKLTAKGKDATKAVDDLNSATSRLGGTLGDVFGRGVSAVEEFARTGKADFKSFALDAVQAIQQVLLKIALLQAAKAAQNAAGSSGGGLVGGILGLVGTIAGAAAGRASGGPVSAGRTYLVGEKGPELFTPPSRGRIVPNNALAGAGGQKAPEVKVSAPVVVVTDPSEIPNALGTPDGERAIMRVIHRNPEAIRQLVA